MVVIWKDGVKLEVLDSGTVTLPSNVNKVSINVDDLIFHLLFGNTDDEKVNVDGKTISDKEIELKLLNFDNPLGAAFQGTMGSIRGGVLTLSLIAHAVTDEKKDGMPPRVINYSFFRSES